MSVFVHPPRIPPREAENTLTAAKYWLISLIIVMIAIYLKGNLLAVNLQDYARILFQSSVSLFLCMALSTISKFINPLIAYPLFFSITITAFFGFSKTLTGVYSESSNSFLYGLSFYTASLAYLTKQRGLTVAIPYIVSNPLLLVTGPMAVIFHSINHKKISNRLNYYSPFILLGIFLHQIIATPLTPSFALIEKTDSASSIIFAIVFEIFVYSNFAGLSLVIYGLFGIIGVKVPLNFRQPFSSRNLIEFWKGWHTSISVVLRGLFFNPIKKSLGTSAAIFVVFVSSSLWHGTSVNFLLWGFLHAIFFVTTSYLLRRGIPIIPTAIQLCVLVLARMISADSDTERLFTKLTFHFDGFAVLDSLNSMGGQFKFSLALGFIFILTEFAFKSNRNFRKRNYRFFRLPIIQFIILIVMMLSITANSGINYAVYGQR